VATALFQNPDAQNDRPLAGRGAGDVVLTVNETRETCFKWLLLCSRIPMLKMAASWLIEEPDML
jgi:hypothetical protein